MRRNPHSHDRDGEGYDVTAMWEWLKRAWQVGGEEARPPEEAFACPEDARGELRPGHQALDLVFHGPVFSGKRANLQWISARTAPERKGRLMILRTEIEYELSLRIYPRTVRHPSGEPLCVRLRAITGPSWNKDRRETLLHQADGVVFVADSQEDRRDANLEALVQMEHGLGKKVGERGCAPIVFQYTKRDLPGRMSVERMDAELNPRGAPRFTSVVRRGIDVFPTLTTCVGLVVARAKAAEAK